MSYCRFSSENWSSDVYVYQDVYGGWTTHVAGRRRVIPPIPDSLGGSVSMWLHQWAGCALEGRSIVYAHPRRAWVYKAWNRLAVFWHRLHMASVRLIPLRAIGLPYDGDSFNDPTPGDCADRLEHLRALGYRVPQYAIDALREESEE